MDEVTRKLQTINDVASLTHHSDVSKALGDLVNEVTGELHTMNNVASQTPHSDIFKALGDLMNEVTGELHTMNNLTSLNMIPAWIPRTQGMLYSPASIPSQSAAESFRVCFNVSAGSGHTCDLRVAFNQCNVFAGAQLTPCLISALGAPEKVSKHYYNFPC